MHGDRHMCAARACSVVIQMALISPNCTYFVHLSLFVKECNNLFSFLLYPNLEGRGPFCGIQLPSEFGFTQNF